MVQSSDVRCSQGDRVHCFYLLFSELNRVADQPGNRDGPEPVESQKAQPPKSSR